MVTSWAAVEHALFGYCGTLGIDPPAPIARTKWGVFRVVFSPARSIYSVHILSSSLKEADRRVVESHTFYLRNRVRFAPTFSALNIDITHKVVFIGIFLVRSSKVFGTGEIWVFLCEYTSEGHVTCNKTMSSAHDD